MSQWCAKFKNFRLSGRFVKLWKNCNITLFMYFYNHLSNYTKTIIRLRLLNIDEYSPRLCLGEYLSNRPQVSMVYDKPLGMLVEHEKNL